MEQTTQVSARRRRNGAIAAVAVFAVLGVIVWQTWEYWVPGEPPTPPLPIAGPGAMPGGGMPSPQEMRRRAQEEIKAALAVNEEQWAKLQPKVERVTRLQEQLRPRGPMGRGGPPAPPSTAPSDAADYAEKAEMLRQAVDDEQTTPEALAANVAAARAARKKLESELKAAQDDLRKDLAPRQEADLALRGVLD